MNNRTLINLISIAILVISVFVFYNKNYSSDFTVKTPGKDIVVSERSWIKSQDPENYTRNFEAKEKTSKEVYPKIVTIYLNTMSSDRMSGKRISDTEYLEMFVVNPQTVTIQIRKNKGTYWILSRQTFFVSEPLLNINPESSEQSFSLYQSFFQNEIDSTRHILDSEF